MTVAEAQLGQELVFVVGELAVADVGQPDEC